MPSPQVLLYDYVGSICCQMARLTLAEKGVVYAKQSVDIMEKAEQFAPWYTRINPKAVVPTLRIDDEIVTDTMTIVARVDRDLEVGRGPRLTPARPEERDAMNALMLDVMALHYGVLLHSRRRAPDGTCSVLVARGHFLRGEREAHPDRAAALDARIAGNERMQTVLADAAAVERHVSAARTLVDRLDAALAERDFVSAAHWTLADAFATAALARFRLHGFDTWWSDGRCPNVAAYYARVKARPSFAAAGVIDAGVEADL